MSASASEALEIVEHDHAGNVTSTYILSGESRVDVVVRCLLSSREAEPRQNVLIGAASARDEELCATVA